MGPIYSPQRDAGCSTLNFPTSNHLRSVDTASALRHIQRSLSRSPSKGPTFRLITSKSTSPSPSSPLSPSPLSPNRSSTSPNLRFYHDDAFLTVNTGMPPGTRKSRASVRKLSPHRQTKLSSTPQPSPLKRGLSDSKDQGNATSSPPAGLGIGIENSSPTSSPENKTLFGSWSENSGSGMFDSHLAPRHALSMLDKSSTYPAGMPKSSPLKRSDFLMDLDQGGMGSPLAKRRSLHGAALGADFNIFDCEFASSGETTQPRSDLSLASEQPNNLFAVPKRTSSLRKSTLQQRYEKPAPTRTKVINDALPDLASSAQTHTSIRHRTPIENIFPSPARDSPFAQQGPLPNASIHPMALNGKEQFLASMQTHPSRHPLSRTMTQSSDSSTVAEDSPTHVPFRVPEARRPVRDFSRSLPLGVARPDLRESKTRESSEYTPSDGSFSTPENYKNAKPYLAAFMSTGLISKKNKNVDLSQPNFQRDIANMPDTPCKRPTSMIPTPKTFGTTTKPKHSRHSLHSFGTPSTPFNPHATVGVAAGTSGKGVNIFGSSFGEGGLTRRGSFASFEAEDIPQSPSTRGEVQLGNDFDLPPTPSKSFCGRPLQLNKDGTSQDVDNSGTLKIDVTRFGHHTSPSQERNDQTSPHTPFASFSSMLPPDPSGLSISAREEGQAQHKSSFISYPPATPTTPRDHFSQFGKRRTSTTPVHTQVVADIDPSLSLRFDKVEAIGSGDFSQVYRVVEKAESTHGSPSLTRFTTTPDSIRSQKPKKVFAVKRSRNKFLGEKDKTRKLQEVTILKALGLSDHVVQYVDSWERSGYLYIQTEYCEEGALDVFLGKVGLDARLDDFRIWKILLELSLGAKHIHDCGFLHLDLKPANVLITFEGILKIADFGMATTWPAQSGIEGEGDREYIAPEILSGQYDKPADIYSLGLIMVEIAGNVVLPENGASWQRLRSGDLSDVPSLTWSSEGSNVVVRDSGGQPLSSREPKEEFFGSEYGLGSFSSPRSRQPNPNTQLFRNGELASPPHFMLDPNDEGALEKVVRWMISPAARDRPTADQLLKTTGVKFVLARRRAGATIYEGNWGPADEVLADDAEMIDV